MKILLSVILFLVTNITFAQYNYIPNTPTPQVSRQDYYRQNTSRSFRNYYPRYTPPSPAFNPHINTNQYNNFHYGISNYGIYWYYSIK